MKNASGLPAQIKLKNIENFLTRCHFYYASVAGASGNEFENSSTYVWNLQTASQPWVKFKMFYFF